MAVGAVDVMIVTIKNMTTLDKLTIGGRTQVGDRT